MKSQPMQPVVPDEHGTVRFQPNSLVRYLLDAGEQYGLDMNHLATLPGISAEDWEQFAQLIGYSVSGFGDLSYVSDATYAKAAKQVRQLRVKRVKNLKKEQVGT